MQRSKLNQIMPIIIGVVLTAAVLMVVIFNTDSTKYLKSESETSNSENISDNTSNNENIYLIGKYKGMADMTDIFINDYYSKRYRTNYKDDTNIEVTNDYSPLLVQVELTINSDGSYKLSTSEGQIRMAFDLFVCEADNIHKLELAKLCDNNEENYEELKTDRNMTTDELIDDMLERFNINKYKKSYKGDFEVIDGKLAFADGTASIEQRNNSVKINFENNDFTVSLIKKY